MKVTKKKTISIDYLNSENVCYNEEVLETKMIFLLDYQACGLIWQNLGFKEHTDYPGLPLRDNHQADVPESLIRRGANMPHKGNWIYGLYSCILCNKNGIKGLWGDKSPQTNVELARLLAKIFILSQIRNIISE